MLLLFEKIARLRNQREVVLRHAEPGHVAQMATLREAVAYEGRIFANLRYSDRETLEATILAQMPSKDAMDGIELLAWVQSGEESAQEGQPFVVADVLMTRRRDELLAHSAELHLAIHQAWRGVGLGSVMLRAALRWARVAHIEKVDMAVRASNTSYRSLLATFGFQPDGRRRAFYKTPDGYEDQYWYALFLKQITKKEVVNET